MSGCRFEVPQFSVAARIATRCSQFRHNASRGSKGSMPSSLRTLSSIQVPGMVCIGPLPPPGRYGSGVSAALNPHYGADPMHRNRRSSGRLGDEGCTGFDARYTEGTRRPVPPHRLSRRRRTVARLSEGRRKRHIASRRSGSSDLRGASSGRNDHFIAIWQLPRSRSAAERPFSTASLAVLIRCGARDEA